MNADELKQIRKNIASIKTRTPMDILLKTAVDKLFELIITRDEKINRLTNLLNKCFIGGNSLGSVIGGLSLPDGHDKWTYDEASAYLYAKYDKDTAFEYYETWLCWKTLRDAQAELEALNA